MNLPIAYFSNIPLLHIQAKKATSQLVWLIAFPFVIAVRLECYARFENGDFTIAFLLVVDFFTARYADNIIDEAFAYLVNRFIFDNGAVIEVNPHRFVGSQSCVGGNLHGRHIYSLKSLIK